MFLPPNIKDCLPKDHMCFMVDQVVNSLDLKAVEESYSDNGCPGYDPAMMVKIIFYAYIQGQRSSRKIEGLTYENIVFKYLSANQNPDHGTINLFRKNHLQELEKIFAQIVVMCNGLGMINPKDISIDGTVFKASASKKNTLDKNQIEKLRNNIKDFLKEADELDELEDKKYGKDKRGNEMPEHLVDPKARQKAIDELKRKLKLLDQADAVISRKQESARTNKEKQKSFSKSINITDPDAQLMKMKNSKSVYPAYNGQIATSKQVVLSYDVSQDANDVKNLLPMIKETENNTNIKVKIVKADSVYFSRENIDGISLKHIDAYIPDKKKSFDEHRESTNSIPKFDRKNFKYDAKKDCFVCPGKKKLPFVSEHKGYRKYICGGCQNCKLKSGCISGKKRYLLISPVLEKYKKDMREKLNSKSGKAKYLERMSDVEPVFANIVSNLGFKLFHRRGKPQAKTEFGLFCIAHNLVKIFNHLKRSNNFNQNLKEIIKLNTSTRLQVAV